MLRKVSNGFFKNDNGDDGGDILDMNGLVVKLKQNNKSLKGCLEEAKFELLWRGREWEYNKFAKLVQSGMRLTSTMAALRRSIEFKWELLREDSNSSGSNSVSRAGHGIGDDDEARSLKSFLSRSSSMYNKFMDSDDDDARSSQHEHTADSSNTDSQDEEEVADPKELFDLFIYHLGPPTKSFTYTMRQILDGIPFDEKLQSVETLVDQYYKSLQMAIELYTKNQEKSVNRLYRQELFQKQDVSDNSTFDFEAKVDQEDVAASCDPTIF
ncbi:unnamed protein product [Ambrosiozyma monospora]|uniref:Unnamed protein product n=1 Tax=Ambrosiozyma monospora TaxID=43982 RepID=A0ACB5TU14_AMBMO|nr:unnamed protein product [Ambrosiozyma monospora]